MGDVVRCSGHPGRADTRSRSRDKYTEVHVSRSDYTREWCLDLFKGLQRDQSLQGGCAGANVFLSGPDILFACGDIRFGGLGSRRVSITILTRHGAAGREHLVPLPGDISQIARSDKLLQGRFRLAELPFSLRHSSTGLDHLLIEIGRIDLGQQLSTTNTVPDVDIPLFQVP